MTIMHKHYVEPPGPEDGARVERPLQLPPALYQTLVKQRADIASIASAHILWDEEANTVTLLGTEDAVQQTGAVLSQLVAAGGGATTGGRKLVGRSHLGGHPGRLTASASLLTGSLPPELTVGQHMALGRTVSDSQTKVRRKLESEDSSYDSDHEGMVASLSHPYHTLSRSHDDISRTPSETLAQEYVDYVQEYAVRDPSPVQDARLASVRETPSDCQADLHSLVATPQYTAKVLYGLKMGYDEKVTQRALTKVGLDAGQDELLQELIRLQEARTSDPEEVRLKETQELLRAALPSQEAAGRGRGGREAVEGAGLRAIVIDGSNVAMSHGNPAGTFSCHGIQLCVDWFWERGHRDITVFVPKWRKEASRVDVPITNQNLLEKLEKKQLLTFTPSRNVNGKRIVCHDDRYILNLAAESQAVVVSNDNYRELINEKPGYKKVIEERILMYSFVNDTFMPPDDPLGKNGPNLDSFLKLKIATSSTSGMETKPCPYKEKCTYGNKCKYSHAERGNAPHKSVTERLKEESSKQIREVRTRNTSRDSSPGEQLTRTRSMNLPVHRTESDMKVKQQLARTRSSRPYGTPAQESMYRLSKADVAKTKSVESSARFGPPHLRSIGIQGLEMGCLSNYGAAPPPFQPVYSPHQQPPPQDQGNHHRRLERQLTINPSFDPRINKEKLSPGHQQTALPDMEYMRSHLPPPLGLTVATQDDFPHQNVTRNASAPDSIRQWGGQHPGALPGPSLLQPPGISPPPLEESRPAPALHSPMQRLNSTSDTQLNRGFINRALSSDPFSSSDTWKYRDFSPLLGSSIWGQHPSPPKLDTPPPSPSRSGRPLGPVGSRPLGTQAAAEGCRAQLHFHLCGLFPTHQVEHVMGLMPEEDNAQVLCQAIMELHPAK